MCVACDLLTGLDLDALSVEGGAPPPGLHLPDGNAGLDLDAAREMHLRRLPTQGSNAHWAARDPAADLRRVFDEAHSAYEAYRRAAAAGRIPAGLRWQFALPSPFTWLSRSVEPAEVAARLPGLQAQLVEELRRLRDAVPVGDVALQWDLAAETALWESRGRDLTAGRKLAGKVLEGLVSLAADWPAQAQLGYHLCRREAGGRTAPDPLDAAQISHLAGALLASVDRNIDFLHLPAPREPASPDWFAPLGRLQAWPDTELHVGIAWGDDTPESVGVRLQAAAAALARFAPAPACGERPVAARLLVQDALAAVNVS
jgi:hypothetical protein